MASERSAPSVGEPLVLTYAGSESPGVCEGIVQQAGPSSLRVQVPNEAFRAGDDLEVMWVVPGDARYVRQARVQDVGDHVVELRSLSEWTRVQQREFVRIRVRSLVPVEIRRTDANGHINAEGLEGTLLDLSAGGALLAVPEKEELGAQLCIRFRLLAVGEVHAKASVVRIARIARGHTAASDEPAGFRIGLRFTEIAVGMQTSILRWVFSQQVKTSDSVA